MLGGNLPGTREAMGEAIKSFAANGLMITAQSSVYASEAVDCVPGAPDFLDMAISGNWQKSAAELLHLGQAIERAAGCKENNIAKSQIGTENKMLIPSDLGFGYQEHFSVMEENDYIELHRCMYNPHLDMTFFRGICCCNLVPYDVIPERLHKAVEIAAAVGTETFNVGSHEQYTFPYYHNYIPDHMERLSKAIEIMVENGCKPVFFSEGLLGNEAWGK